MRIAAFSPWIMVSRDRFGSILLLTCAAAFLGAPAVLSARDLQPIDALAEAPLAKANSASHFGSGALASFHGHFEERLDIPTFLSAKPGAVRQSGALLMSQDPEQIARGHLRSLADVYKISAAEVDALPVKNTQRLPNGAAIVQFGHVVNGIEVFREGAGVLVNADGSLGSVGGYVSGAGATGKANAQALFKLEAQDAVAATLKDFDFVPSAVRGALRSAAAHDGYDYFTLADHADSGDALAQSARTKPVFFRTAAGLVPGWYVEINVSSPLAGDDSYYSYVVSAKDGTLLFRHDLTAHSAFAYRVWAETTPPYLPYPGPSGRNGTPHPTATPDGYQAPFVLPNLVSLSNALPGTSVAANDPWLPAGATQTLGNNVDAYADLFAPDGFSNGDLRASTTGSSTFDRTYDTAQVPLASQNQTMAAVTQLFYLNNWLHDWYYDVGFDEASGNAQTNNFGRGGVADDPVHAEAQDYSGLDNANMSTPADGASPRMQMYLWTGKSAAAVSISGNASGDTVGGGAAFGPTQFDVTGDVVYANDGVVGTGTVNDGCTAIMNSVSGKIALIDRGTCSFKTKAVNAQASGAIGLLIVNNVATGAIPLGDDATIATVVTIPVLSLAKADGDVLKPALPGVSARLHRVRGIDRDGTIDNTIVAHEWGHYISNRLVHDSAGLTTNMSRGMGEGFADFHALLMSVKAEDAAVLSNPDFSGTYAEAGYVSGGPSLAGSPNNGYYYGLRRYPYSTVLTRNPLTYQYIQKGVPLPASPPPNGGGDNSEVHNTGEVWASMLWECYASLLNDTPRLTFSQAQDRMKRYLVAGYKLMPVAPTFLDARDAILSAIHAQDNADYLDCAAGFAKRGLGVGAQSPDRFSADNIGVVESFVSDAAAGAWTSADIDDAAGTCDGDGELDSLESGTVALKLHNDGFQPMSATVISLNSPDAFVSVPPQVTPPPIAAYATATLSIPIQLANISGIQTFTLNYSADDPMLIAAVPGQKQFRVNVDNVASKSDDFESRTLAWTPVLQGLSDPGEQWSRLEIDATHHVAYGPDAGAQGLSMLVSPALQVSASGSFVLAFKHNYQFETGINGSTTSYFDGGVVEISQDDGANWTDVTIAGGNLSPAYNGVIYTDPVNNTNPLSSRPAYVGNSGAGFTAVSVDFGSALQGKTVKVRFVVGTDGSAGAAGWQIDDFVATGIDNKPFTTLVADPGHCVINDRVYASGFEVP